MKSYYETLEIESGASAADIKRAYFRLVRRFSPERFPEEFKKLREAYETLSDEDKRAKYDRTEELPKEAAYLLGHAQKALREGRGADAEKILAMAIEKNPGIHILREELARFYEYEGKTGNAAKTWEELCGFEPENAGYLLELAKAYKLRGWRKKAIERLLRAVELDPSEAWAWVELFESYGEAGQMDEAMRICELGIEAVEKAGGSSVTLYTYAFTWRVAEDEAAAEECLKAIADTIRENRHTERDACGEAAKILLDTIMISGCHGLIKYVRQIERLLPEQETKELRDKLLEAETVAEIRALGDEGYSPLFHDLFAALQYEPDTKDAKDDIRAMECSVLTDIEGYRIQLSRLKDEHPKLYASYSGFFDEALSARSPEKLLLQRISYFARKNIEPIIILADGSVKEEVRTPPETFRREGPKIGRNEPCPCGSGKKYKKCCG